MPFRALYELARLFPEEEQLLGELAVLVDPKTVSARFEQELQGRGLSLDVAAYTKALQEAFFVVRCSYFHHSSVSAAAFSRHFLPDGVFRSALQQRGLLQYEDALARCALTSANAVCSASPQQIDALNLRSPHRTRLLRLAQDMQTEE